MEKHPEQSTAPAPKELDHPAPATPVWARKLWLWTVTFSIATVVVVGLGLGLGLGIGLKQHSKLVNSHN
jgi:hypothetical protein